MGDARIREHPLERALRQGEEVAAIAAGNEEYSSSRRIAIARKTNGANAAAQIAKKANPEVESDGVRPGLIAISRKNNPTKI